MEGENNQEQSVSSHCDTSEFSRPHLSNQSSGYNTVESTTPTPNIHQNNNEEKQTSSGQDYLYPHEYDEVAMKFHFPNGSFVSEIRSNLMRNVKREKTTPIGFENDARSDKMQTMTIADSCNNSQEDNLHQSNVSTRMSEEDEQDELQLQKQFNELLEENRRLKQKTQKKDVLKRKISLLKKENDTLKTAHEQQLKEVPKPDSSDANVSAESTPASANKEQGVFAKSFLLTSTMGGIYIEPIDAANGLSKAPTDLNNNSMSPKSFNCMNTSPGSSYMFKQDKRMKTIETQTSSSSSSTLTAPLVNNTPNKHNTYHYSPRVKVATTEEDEEAHRFVQEFKARRIALKLTQSDIGEELNLRAGARYGQSYISRMESIQLSTAIVLRMKPLLLKLIEEKEDERRKLKETCADFDEEEYYNDRKRKKRTNFSPEQTLLLTKYFQDQPRPSPQEIDEISRKLEIDRNSVKMWFNNKRQSEKFRLQPLPTIGSISSVGSINPYANPYAAMPPSFLMSGLMSNMQNAINPIVTSASLNNLKLDYNLNNKLPNTTISLENVTLPNSQTPFILSKDLDQLYQQNRIDEPNRQSSEEAKSKLSKDLTQLYQNSFNSAVCSSLSKKDSSDDNKTTDASSIQPAFSLASQPPFIFNKELSSLYQNRTSSEDSSAQKLSSDLVQLYKERVGEAIDNNAAFCLSGSPPGSGSSIKSVSPSRNPAFALSQSIISRTLSQGIATQDPPVTSSSPKYSRTP